MGCMYLAKAVVGVQWLLYRQDSRYWIDLIEAYRYLFNFQKAWMIWLKVMFGWSYIKEESKEY